MILVGYAIPAFILAMVLIILFCGGEYFDWFPLRGLISENHSELTFWEQVKDRLHHLAMPVAALGGRRPATRVWLRMCVQAGHLWSLAGRRFEEYA